MNARVETNLRGGSPHTRILKFASLSIFILPMSIWKPNGLSGKPHLNKHLMTSTLIYFLKRSYRSKSEHVFLLT